jgi:hypothetical protein
VAPKTVLDSYHVMHYLNISEHYLPTRWEVRSNLLPSIFAHE